MKRTLIAVMAILLVLASLCVFFMLTGLYSDKAGRAKSSFLKGTESLTQGDYATAISALKHGLSLRPESYGMRMNLATAYAYSEEFDSAIHEYEEADSLSPVDDEPEVCIGIMYLCKGDEARAQQVLETVEPSWSGDQAYLAASKLLVMIQSAEVSASEEARSYVLHHDLPVFGVPIPIGELPKRQSK